MYLSNKISICLAISINVVDSCVRFAETHHCIFHRLLFILTTLCVLDQLHVWFLMSLEYYTFPSSAQINYALLCGGFHKRAYNIYNWFLRWEQKDKEKTTHTSALCFVFVFSSYVSSSLLTCSSSRRSVETYFVRLRVLLVMVKHLATCSCSMYRCLLIMDWY